MIENINDLILTRSLKVKFTFPSCVLLQTMQLSFKKFFNKIIDSQNNRSYQLQ